MFSVVFGIATNHKQWNMTYKHTQDASYSNYYVIKIKNSIDIYNASRQNILLSGDVQLNPGPETNNDTLSQAEISFDDPRSHKVFELRLLRYRFKTS